MSTFARTSSLLLSPFPEEICALRRSQPLAVVDVEIAFSNISRTGTYTCKS
ncbi:hypothetical protein BE221DRAFT_75583 [Ostreococcus tauri]|uniref:Uncharacterized protein n=1 Tax=Ostreococcus tauri TaxID=70448 RepID=A0A1Y5I981_OSTTA|nr:hypothetical protein BE221DRAFT_75583 [Ostreococcus tauri]